MNIYSQNKTILRMIRRIPSINALTTILFLTVMAACGKNDNSQEYPSDVVTEFFNNSVAYASSGEYIELHAPLEQYFSYPEFLLSKFPDQAIITSTQGQASDSYYPFKYSNRFDPFWHPYEAIIELDIGEVIYVPTTPLDPPDYSAVVEVNLKTIHINYGEYTIYDPTAPNGRSKNSLSAFEALYEGFNAFFEDYFDFGQVNQQDFHGAYQYFLDNVDSELIPPNGVALWMETSEKHTFYFEKKDDTWKILRFERELLEYSLQIK